MATRYHVARTIDAPPHQVWALLTDASSYSDWNPAVVSIDGPIVEGGTVRLVPAVDPKRTFTLEVTVADAPHRMVWSDVKPLGLFRGERTYLLADRDGGTDLTITEVFSGPLAPLVTRFIPDLTASFTQFADGLKRGAERS